MVKWKKYRDFGRINQMRNEGRELIGETIYWTEKRDGSNISFWLNDDGSFRMSSHNMEEIGEDLVRICDLESTRNYSYSKLKEMLDENPNCIIYCELIYAGQGPTRTEPKHKYPQLVLFDMYNTKTEQYLSYNYLYQVAHKYKFPIVKLVHTSIPPDIDQLYNTRDFLLDWCKKHRREGVVGKCWKSTNDGYESFYFKEKIDLPKRPKLMKPAKDEIKLPAMPLDKIHNAIDQAREECERAGNPFNNPKFAMPLVANHLNTQAKEHDYAIPDNFYKLYSDYLDKRRKDLESDWNEISQG